MSMRRSAGQAHWQQGVLERHQMRYEDIIKRVIDEQTVTADEIDFAVTCVDQAKNQLRRRHGYSPSPAGAIKGEAVREGIAVSELQTFKLAEEEQIQDTLVNKELTALSLAESIQ